MCNQSTQCLSIDVDDGQSAQFALGFYSCTAAHLDMSRMLLISSGNQGTAVAQLEDSNPLLCLSVRPSRYCQVHVKEADVLQR